MSNFLKDDCYPITSWSATVFQYTCIPLWIGHGPLKVKSNMKLADAQGSYVRMLRSITERATVLGPIACPSRSARSRKCLNLFCITTRQVHVTSLGNCQMKLCLQSLFTTRYLYRTCKPRRLFLSLRTTQAKQRSAYVSIFWNPGCA